MGNIGVEGKEIERNSKDKIIGNGDRNLVEGSGYRKRYILNGAMDDDWEREFTYVGTRGNTVRGYVIVNEKMRDRIVKFKVRERVNLDHISLGMKVEEEQRRG